MGISTPHWGEGVEIPAKSPDLTRPLTVPCVTAPGPFPSTRSRLELAEPGLCERTVAQPEEQPQLRRIRSCCADVELRTPALRARYLFDEDVRNLPARRRDVRGRLRVLRERVEGLSRKIDHEFRDPFGPCRPGPSAATHSRREHLRDGVRRVRFVREPV